MTVCRSRKATGKCIRPEKETAEIKLNIESRFGYGHFKTLEGLSLASGVDVMTYKLTQNWPVGYPG